MRNEQKKEGRKMMRKMVVLSVALILSFVFCSVSEAVNLKKGIIGKWVEVEGGGSYEFLKDGTVIKGSTAGSYKFIDDNRLKVDLGPSGIKVFEVSIDKQGQLILTDPAGEIERYITKAEKEKREAAEGAELKMRIKGKVTFSDLTVLDNETKLMWTRDGNIAGKEMTWDDAVKFIENLNGQKYGGYNDWRLPSIEELETLVNFAKGQGYTEEINQYFNKIGFKNMQAGAGYYWSSTTYTAYGTGFAWIVHMWNGNVRDFIRTANYYVLPVRAGQ